MNESYKETENRSEVGHVFLTLWWDSSLIQSYRLHVHTFYSLRNMTLSPMMKCLPKTYSNDLTGHGLPYLSSAHVVKPQVFLIHCHLLFEEVKNIQGIVCHVTCEAAGFWRGATRSAFDKWHFHSLWFHLRNGVIVCDRCVLSCTQTTLAPFVTKKTLSSSTLGICVTRFNGRAGGETRLISHTSCYVLDSPLLCFLKGQHCWGCFQSVSRTRNCWDRCFMCVIHF